ncbi:MAG: DAK2 domain-containing protein, partial [Thermoguttaceae bacterium]|nr:DAK2 domain-containing protein [Thermoguttaceae bacterium]
MLSKLDHLACSAGFSSAGAACSAGFSSAGAASSAGFSSAGFSSAGAACYKSGSKSLPVVAKTFSRGLLMGARGNSGVILSQIFRG